MKKSTKRMLKKVKSLNTKKMDKIVEIISKESHKSKLYIKFDMLVNFLVRGTGYTDYFRGNFINLTKKEKDTFVTAKSFYKLIHYFNDYEYIAIFYDKLLFDHFFKDYLKRDFINLRKSTKEEYLEFLNKHEIVFIKDPLGECGHGIKKVVVNEIEDKDKFYDEIMKNKQYLIEEAIIQSKELNEINPKVVNSFRVVTLVKDGKAYIVGNALRVNQFDNDVIGCTNDVYFSLNEEGRIDSKVIDDFGNIYKTHPLTSKEFDKVIIPDVKEAFEMCKKAALEVPEVRYVGWDVAFSNKGPVIVEGNEYPGYGILQFYKLKDKRTGHLKDVEDIVGDEIKNIKKLRKKGWL